MRPWHLSCLALALWGCDASFEDLRPTLSESRASDTGFASPSDLGVSDGLDGGTPDATGLDAQPGVDQPSPVLPRVIAEGSWRPVDYEVRGSASLLESEGGLELRLSDDFSAFAVPGPVLVLTTRDRLGTRIRPDLGDLRIGELRQNSGPQTYPLPLEATAATTVWIFCEPFGLEVGRANLEPRP